MRAGQNSRPADILKRRRNPRQKKAENPAPVRLRKRKGSFARSDPIELKAAPPSNSKSSKKLEILDATLRERTFGVSFSVGEKVSIVNLLSSMGVSYIESPAPERNPNEIEYLKQAKAIFGGRSEAVIFLPESVSYTSSGDNSSAVVPDWVRTLSLRVNCWQSHLTEGF